MYTTFYARWEYRIVKGVTKMCSNRVYSLLYKLKRISYIAYETSLQTSSMFNKSDFANY